MAKKPRTSGPALSDKGRDSAATRRRRQAAQLRENLLKRKEQGRTRADESGVDKGPPGGDADR